MFAVARNSFRPHESYHHNQAQVNWSFLSLQSPQPVKAQAVTGVVRPESPDCESEASKELQEILSCFNHESLSSSGQSSFLRGGQEPNCPRLAQSPTTQRPTASPSFQDFQEAECDIHRACNPIVCNTPFVRDDIIQGAELGLLSPSPPPQEVLYPVHTRRHQDLIAEQRQRKRARSISCPEAKSLL